MKKCCVISAFNPITTSQFNEIKLLLKQGFKEVYVSMIDEQPVQKRLIEAYIKPFKKIHYMSNANESDFDLVITDTSLQLEHMQNVRYGCYWDMPQWAANILNKTGIYYEEMLRHFLREKRYLHSKSVQQVSIDIAKCNHLDVSKASTIGLLHDICKQMEDNIIIEYALKMDKDALNYPLATLHAQAGAYYVKNFMRIKDRQIIEAIRYHALGEKVSPYVRMVFVADKADPSRGYDSSKTLMLTKHNLANGYRVCKEESIAFLKQHHKI